MLDIYFRFVFTLIFTFKKISSPAAGLFWSLFLPLFYFCFYHYSKKSSPAAGLFLRLVYLCFYLCFWFYVYLVFYPCLTLVFSFILLLCLPWFCFLPSIVSYQGTETFACRRNQLLLAKWPFANQLLLAAIVVAYRPGRMSAGTKNYLESDEGKCPIWHERLPGGYPRWTPRKFFLGFMRNWPKRGPVMPKSGEHVDLLRSWKIHETQWMRKCGICRCEFHQSGGQMTEKWPSAPKKKTCFGS